MRLIAWDDPAVARLGAIDWRRSSRGLSPRRLPAWADLQMPDPTLAMMARMTSGVRLAFRTDATDIELDVLATGLRIPPAPRRPVTFDLMVDGELFARQACDVGPTIVADTRADPPSASIAPGLASTLRFSDLPSRPKDVELWLPQSASTDLQALRISAQAVIGPPSLRPLRWAHYGSSISHGMDADGPTGAWPAVTARLAGVELTSLGFAGQCHLDGLVARTIRDGDFDRISLKLGINVVNLDSMRERAFTPALHGFLDLIRERAPDTPILVVSPILCPVAEDHPGPTQATDAGISVIARPPGLSAGALTLRRIRVLLAKAVEVRRGAGDRNLHYLDGIELFGEADAKDLPDGLHPHAAGLIRIGQRFAAKAFGAGGPLDATRRQALTP